MTRRFVSALVAGLMSASTVSGQSWLTDSGDLVPLDVNTICRCAGQSDRGGISTRDEFHEAYDWINYQSDEEASLAWQVFSQVSTCEATIFIGRLDDTGQVPLRAGSCILRDYADWTPGINDAFIAAGLERGAEFAAVSPPVGEILPDGDGHRQNVYNRELTLLDRDGIYQLSGDISTASPSNPATFAPVNSWALSLEFDGALSGLPMDAVLFEVGQDGRVAQRFSDAQQAFILDGLVGGRAAAFSFVLRGWDDDADGFVDIFSLSLDGLAEDGSLRGEFSGTVVDFECAMSGLFDDTDQVCGYLPTSGRWQAAPQ